MLSLAVWVGGFAVVSLLCAWVIYWGGDEQLLGNAFVSYLLGAHTGGDPDFVRLAAGCCWALYGLWFVIGLLLPEARWPLR